MYHISNRKSHNRKLRVKIGDQQYVANCRQIFVYILRSIQYRVLKILDNPLFSKFEMNFEQNQRILKIAKYHPNLVECMVVCKVFFP